MQVIHNRLTECFEFVELQNDIVSSLRSRLDLLCDEAERAAEDAQCSDSKESEDPAIKLNLFSHFLRPGYAQIKTF